MGSSDPQPQWPSINAPDEEPQRPAQPAAPAPGAPFAPENPVAAWLAAADPSGQPADDPASTLPHRAAENPWLSDFSAGPASAAVPPPAPAPAASAGDWDLDFGSLSTPAAPAPPAAPPPAAAPVPPTTVPGYPSVDPFAPAPPPAASPTIVTPQPPVTVPPPQVGYPTVPAPPAPSAPPVAAPPTAPQPARRAAGLMLEVTIGRRTTELRMTDGEMLIGRADTARGVVPAIDLTADDAVSRRHAKIVGRGGSYFLSDLGSTNGTKINNRWLEPNREVPLAPGDRIEVGALTTILVVEAPPE